MNLKKSPDNEFSQLVDETLNTNESSRPQLVSMENFNIPEEEAESEAIQFYFLKGHTKVGPYNKDEISELIAKKELIYTDFISSNEGKSWIKIFENPYFDRRKVSRDDLPINPSDESFLHSNLEVLVKLNNQASSEDTTQDILAGFAYSHNKNMLEKREKASHTSVHPIHIVKKNRVEDDQTKTVRLQTEMVTDEASREASDLNELPIESNGLMTHIKKIILHVKVLKFYLLMACSLSLALATIAIKTFNDSKVSDLHPDTHTPPARIKKRLIKALEQKKSTLVEPVQKNRALAEKIPQVVTATKREPVEESEPEMGQRDDSYEEGDPYEQDPVRRRLEPQTVQPTQIRNRIQNNANELDENLRNSNDGSLKEEFVDQ